MFQAATIRENHDRFVSRVAHAEIVWALENSNGCASCPSNEVADRQVIIFWSDAAYAKRVSQSAFPEHEPVEISLFDFLFRWLRGMQGDAVFAGTNWTPDLAGLEVSPADLRNQLLKAMGNEKVERYAGRLRVELERQNSKKD
jgi:hypothetical protein